MSLRDIVNQLENHPNNLTNNQKIDGFFDAVAPDWDDKKKKFRKFDWGAPDVREVNYVLNTLAGWVAGEVKINKKTGKAMTGLTSPDNRANYIRHIKTYFTNKTTNAFVGIDPGIFAIQLALRVRRPRSFDQGATGLCGAVSAAYTFAKTRPDDFVTFALNLFFNGQAIFGTLLVQPSAKIRNNYPLRAKKIHWAVDYVVLVSLRECTFTSDKIGIDLVRGADETTLPGKFAEWLRDAGYTNIEDHTFFGKNQQAVVQKFASTIGQPMHFGGANVPVRPEDEQAKADRVKHARQNLDAASRALTLGKLVFLFSDGELAQSLNDQRSGGLQVQKGPTSLGHHHWMAVRELKVTGSNAVYLKAITWGKSVKGYFDMDAFVSRYNGYIVADA